MTCIHTYIHAYIHTCVHTYLADFFFVLLVLELILTRASLELVSKHSDVVIVQRFQLLRELRVGDLHLLQSPFQRPHILVELYLHLAVVVLQKLEIFFQLWKENVKLEVCRKIVCHARGLLDIRIGIVCTNYLR